MFLCRLTLSLVLRCAALCCSTMRNCVTIDNVGLCCDNVLLRGKMPRRCNVVPCCDLTVLGAGSRTGSTRTLVGGWAMDPAGQASCPPGWPVRRSSSSSSFERACLVPFWFELVVGCRFGLNRCPPSISIRPLDTQALLGQDGGVPTASAVHALRKCMAMPIVSPTGEVSYDSTRFKVNSCSLCVRCRLYVGLGMWWRDFRRACSAMAPQSTYPASWRLR
jgi:hypothetical protein